MRRLCATVMTIVVGWQAVGAAASAADVGPIERAAITEATRLAIEMPAPSVPGSWLGMRRRPSPGDSIGITMVAGTRTRIFVALDQVSLTVLNLQAPGLTEPVRHDLLRLAQTNPGVIVDAASAMPKRYQNIQFGPTGIVVEPRQGRGAWRGDRDFDPRGCVGDLAVGEARVRSGDFARCRRRALPRLGDCVQGG
jgi:hypothetical protein